MEDQSEEEGDTMEEGDDDAHLDDQAEVPHASIDGAEQGGKRKALPDGKTPAAKRPAALKKTTPASGREFYQGRASVRRA